MEQLKKCPFCGSEATWDFLNGYKTMGWSIVCIQCRSRCGYHATKEEAITAWNTRKPMEQIVDRLEETKGKDIVFCPPRANNKTAMLGQRIGLDRAIEIVKEEMQCLSNT